MRPSAALLLLLLLLLPLILGADIQPAQATRCWQAAIELGGGNPKWQPPPVLVHDELLLPGLSGRIHGEYELRIRTRSTGQLEVVERIHLFLLPRETAHDLLLIHEYLHAVYQRRATKPRFLRKHPDAELWIKGLMP